MKTKFKSKNKTNFTPVGSTRTYFDIVYAKFQSITSNSKSITVKGIWYWIDVEGNQRKINGISFEIAAVYFKQIEYQLGRLNVANRFDYDDERLEQIFPMQLDKEKANDAQANFTLGGDDVEIVEE